MSKKTFLIITIIILIIISVVFTIIFLNSNKKDNVLQEKIEGQLNYVEKEIINMINELNNISFINATIKQTTEKTTKSKDSKSDSSSTSSSSGGESSSSGSSSGGESSSELATDSSQSATATETDKKEIKYTTEITGILNSDFSDVDWEYLKNNIENLYSIWNIAIIDLHQLNINNQDILNFSSSLDQVALSIKNEDKIATINNLANLYAYIPKYLEQFEKESRKINIAYTKNCIINTYVFVEQGKWNDVKDQTQKAINYFSEVINNAEQNNNKYNNNKITKIYVLLNELNNTIDLNDKELYYIKYRNAMDELVNI